MTAGQRQPEDTGKPQVPEHRSARPAQPLSESPALADALRLAATAWAAFRGGASLDRALADAQAAAAPLPHPRLAAAAKDIAYTAVRHLALIEDVLRRLVQRAPEPAVAGLLAVAVGQLLADRHAHYTVVDQAVRAARDRHDTQQASGFVNAVLRNALRRLPDLRPELERQPVVALNAPRWWIERVRAAAPEQFDAILRLQRQAPPLVLRVNRRHGSVDDYLARLQRDGIGASRVGPEAVWLHAPLPVHEIPGFDAGDVSVQDAGAQLAVPFLDPQRGMRVLDACAAPGGKTAQLAEVADDLEIDAVDSDPGRVGRIEDNLRRTRAREHARIHVHVADAARPGQLGTGRYARILLDAPCTASGIVRRHPDIPWLRRAADVAQLATLQARLLEALWPLLEPAGRLLYVVCSLFPEEGPRQVERFAGRHADARPVDLPGIGAAQLSLLPAQADRWSGAMPGVHDGFFFAMFEKS